MKELTSPQTEYITGAAACSLPGIIAAGVFGMVGYATVRIICDKEIVIKDLAFLGFVGLTIGAMTTVV
jgi:hypothetical protein